MCAFCDKAVLAQAAGALGLVVLNGRGMGELTRMPIASTEGADIALPAVMISAEDGDALRALAASAASAAAASSFRVVKKAGICPIKRPDAVTASRNATGPARPSDVVLTTAHRGRVVLKNVQGFTDDATNPFADTFPQNWSFSG